jgi:hypothetical protein
VAGLIKTRAKLDGTKLCAAYFWLASFPLCVRARFYFSFSASGISFI